MNLLYKVEEYIKDSAGPSSLLKWTVYIEDKETAEWLYKYLDVPSYNRYTGTYINLRKVCSKEAIGKQIYTKETIKDFVNKLD